jgi:hypothetical protein
VHHNKQMPKRIADFLEKHIHALFVLLLVLNGWDATATALAVGSGAAHEANPLMAFLMESFGMAGFMVFKLLIMNPLIAGIAVFLDRKDVAPKIRRFAAIALAVDLSIYIPLGIYHIIGLSTLMR